MDTLLSWSGGKDAAFALHALETDTAVGAEAAGGVDPADCEVVELLTTVSTDTGRTTMHGVRPNLVEAQADALDLPLTLVDLPADASNEQYEARMAEAMGAAARRGVERVAFADLFLEDVRAYREERLAEGPVPGVWPIWGLDTADVADAFLEAGFEAVVVAVDGRELESSFAGRRYDRAFLADLPDGVDPCGENGEFHTFVADGPEFADRVAVEVGGTVTRESGDADFHYCDLLPADEPV